MQILQKKLALSFLASLFFTTPVSASDTTYVDPCIDAIVKANGPDTPKGGGVVSQDISQASGIVILEDALGQTWRCLAYSDGSVGELSMIDGKDDGEGAMDGAVASNGSGDHPHRVHFAKGATGTIFDVKLSPGQIKNYLLNARKEQFLTVSVDSKNPKLFFKIYVPDGGVLYDSTQAGNFYYGQLYENGDHRVEVYLSSDEKNSAEAAVTFKIK